MPKNIIELEDVYIAKIKKRLRAKFMSAKKNQDVVNYAMEVAVNCITYLDDDSLSVVEPFSRKKINS